MDGCAAPHFRGAGHICGRQSWPPGRRGRRPAPEMCVEHHGTAGTKAEHMTGGRELKDALIVPQMLPGEP